MMDDDILPELPSCCIKRIETSVCCCAPDHEKQSCWGWLVLQRVNIFHWCLQVVIYCTIIYWLNRWMLHWVTNETAFEACTSFAISRWKIWLWTVSASGGRSERETRGKFSRGLALCVQDGRVTVVWLRWRRTSEDERLCCAEVFNTAEVNNAVRKIRDIFIVLGLYSGTVGMKWNNDYEVKMPISSTFYT